MNRILKNLLALILVLISSTLTADDFFRKNNIWIDTGVGFAVINSDLNLINLYQRINVKSNDNIFSYGRMEFFKFSLGSHSLEEIIFGAYGYEDEDEDNIGNNGIDERFIMFGYMENFGVQSVIVKQIGLNSVAQTNDNGSRIGSDVVGIPLDISIYNKHKYYASNINFHLNLNEIDPVFSLNIGISLGYFN